MRCRAGGGRLAGPAASVRAGRAADRAADGRSLAARLRRGAAVGAGRRRAARGRAARRRSRGSASSTPAPRPAARPATCSSGSPGPADVTALDVSGAAACPGARQPRAARARRRDVRAGDAGEPAAWWDGRPYDRILLDVPCSATGVIRRHPDIKVLRRAGDIPALARRQAGTAARRPGACSRPGGTLLYTSCSVLRAENEGVVRGFLAAHPGGRGPDGRPDPRAGPPDPAGAGPGYLVLPGEAGMDGFYYACLRKRP